MDTVSRLKIELFDILVQQDTARAQIDALERVKQEKLKELQQASAEAAGEAKA